MTFSHCITFPFPRGVPPPPSLAPFISLARAPLFSFLEIVPDTLALYYRARKDHRVLLFLHVSIYTPLISIQFSVGVVVRSV
jgi:hypothetical protein